MSRNKAIIILAWNNWQTTKQCLDSLMSSALDNTEIVVLNNGSSDETKSELAKYQDITNMTVINLPKNLGYVLGNNEAAKYSKKDADIILINSDIVFTQSNWLYELEKSAYQQDSIGIVGCRLQNDKQQLIHAGTLIMAETMWGQQMDSGKVEQDINQFNQDRIVQGVIFAVAYIKRHVFEKLSGLSTEFHSYFEDTDFCLRAKQQGFATICCGAVSLTHNQHGSTQNNATYRHKLFNQSRQIFNKKWKKILANKYTTTLAWQSILNFPTGYAMSSQAIIKALDDAKVHISYKYVYGPNTPFPVPEKEDMGHNRLNIICKRPFAKKPNISVVYGQGDVFARNQGKYKIGFTMLEVDGFPEQWIKQANKMDEVWVPSEFNKQTMLDSGLKRPIYKIPLGVDCNYFNPQIKSLKNKNKDYVFFTNIEWGERKNPQMQLQQFNKTFKASDDVCLIAKLNNRDPSINLQQEIKNLKLQTVGGRIYFIINRIFDFYQLPLLYRSIDCYITAGRGEGWDMPLMEAMACGLPTIATNWGAHQEFATAENCYLLDITGTIPAQAKCPYYAGFNWANPDANHFSELLLNIYNNQATATKKGMLAAKQMQQNWSWENTASKIIERIGNIA
ncbi:MAG: glycosyltransferase [Proteobacteria bacterium]|nr:glycosyltransferase [Pseudomonadota bacterium]